MLVVFVMLCILLPIVGGIHHVKSLEMIGTPVLVLASVALLIWATVTVGLSESLTATYRYADNTRGHEGSSVLSILLNLSAVVGNWGAMILNICDFARYSPDRTSNCHDSVCFRRHCCNGCCNCSQFGFCTLELITHFESHNTVFIVSLVLSFGAACSIIPGNLVSAAQDISNVKNTILSMRKSYTIIGMLSIALLPHKLFGNAQCYMIWLILSSSVQVSQPFYYSIL